MSDEALVQQIAEALRESVLNEQRPDRRVDKAARAVLPVVEAQVAPLRDEVERLRAILGDSRCSDVPALVRAWTDLSAQVAEREGEGGCECTVTDDVVMADSTFQGRYMCGGCGHEPHPNSTASDHPVRADAAPEAT